MSVATEININVAAESIVFREARKIMVFLGLFGLLFQVIYFIAHKGHFY